MASQQGIDSLKTERRTPRIGSAGSRLMASGDRSKVIAFTPTPERPGKPAQGPSNRCGHPATQIWGKRRADK